MTQMESYYQIIKIAVDSRFSNNSGFLFEDRSD